VLSVDSAQTFRVLLGQVRASLLEADRHRRYPFALVLDALQRSASGHDLFDTLIAHAALHGAAPGVGQAMTVTIQPQASSVVLAGAGTMAFDDADATRRLFARVLKALQAGLVDPDVPMATLDLVGPDERARIVTQWNPPGEVGPPTTVHEMIAAHTRERPAAVAAATVDGAYAISYGDLDARSTRLARQLVVLGVAPDAVVGICLESVPELLVAILAAWKAGAAYLPMDGSQPAARLRHMLDDAGARIVIAGAVDHVNARSWSAQVVDVAAPGAPGASTPLPSPDPQRLAYLIYTSGSSGLPKGVMIEHRSLSNYLRWAAAFYRPATGRGVPVTSSPSFDLAVTSLLLPLTCGGRVVLHPELLTSDGLVTRLEATTGAGLLKVTPGQALALGDALPGPALRAATRCLVIGGEALHESHLAEWRRHAPATRLINEYGPTETTVGCCVHETTAAEAGGVVPIGRAIANTRLYVLDADLEPVPDLVVGELYIGGTGLARAFRNLPCETASRFMPDPFATDPGARMYRTSDLAVRRDDGNLVFVGRRDRQVKLRGYRIELGEVERALAAIPGVKAAAASRTGEGHQAQIAAWIVPEGSAPPLRVLRQQLALALPDYMVPQSIAVMRALPQTTNGKIDYGKLVPPANEPTRAAALPLAGTTAAATALLAIWRDVLDAPTLGVDDNFLEYGGDSIVSIRVVGRARQAGWKVLPSQVFEHPTVSMLARVAEPWIERGAAVPEGGRVPLTPVQRWFLESASRCACGSSATAKPGHRRSRRPGRRRSCVRSTCRGCCPSSARRRGPRHVRRASMRCAWAGRSYKQR
jgi:amino acid adenylation domain-containing protein